MKKLLVATFVAASLAGVQAQQKAGPKTPWGDPDISGVWTSDAAIGIPMQRPDRFNGRAELTDEEFKEKEQRDAQTRSRAENAIGSFRNDNAWLAKVIISYEMVHDTRIIYTDGRPHLGKGMRQLLGDSRGH